LSNGILGYRLHWLAVKIGDWGWASKAFLPLRWGETSARNSIRGQLAAAQQWADEAIGHSKGTL
jgi:hypothetical protein